MKYMRKELISRRFVGFVLALIATKLMPESVDSIVMMYSALVGAAIVDSFRTNVNKGE